MKSAVAVLAVLMLGVNLATAQELEPLGPGEQLSSLRLAPALQVVSSKDKAKGLIWIESVHYEFDPVMKEVLVSDKDGTKSKVQMLDHERREVGYKTKIDATKCRFIMPNGKQVAKDDVWKRIRPGSVVVVSGDGTRPDRAYLQALYADTLVIIWDRPRDTPAPPPDVEN